MGDGHGRVGSAEVAGGDASFVDSHRVVVHSADVDLWRWWHWLVHVLVSEVFQSAEVQGKVCDSYSVVVHGADVDLWGWRHWSVVVLVYEIFQCTQVEGKVFKVVYGSMIYSVDILCGINAAFPACGLVGWSHLNL